VSRPAAARGAAALARGDGGGEDASDGGVDGGAVPVREEGGFDEAGHAEPEPNPVTATAVPIRLLPTRSRAGRRHGLDGADGRDHDGQPQPAGDRQDAERPGDAGA
jgi:hypothetical protein